MNLGQLRSAVLAHLGTSDTDRAFPATRVNRWLNDVCNEAYAELPPGYAKQPDASWAADGGTGRAYTLATQSTAVTALRRILRLTLTDDEGSPLREVHFDQLRAWDGLLYAVTGSDESAVVHTSPGIDEAASLYAVYETWPTELSADDDSPSTIPARYHDVLALRAARLAFAAGGEGRFPADLREQLEKREAQLWSAISRRSPDVSLQRQATEVR